MLKFMSGAVKFKITFLPSTIFNQEELTKVYKEASTLGIPGSKSAYAAILGIAPADILSLNYIELNILDMDKLIPLTSGYTTPSADETGRPKKEDTELDDEGEKTRGSGANDNK